MIYKLFHINWFSHPKAGSWREELGAEGGVGGSGEIHIYEQHSELICQYLFFKTQELG
jgi:hypothetical protein